MPMTKEAMDAWNLVIEIDDRGRGLSDWEVDFIGGIIDRKPTYLSEKQISIIQRIHNQKVPR